MNLTSQIEFELHPVRACEECGKPATNGRLICSKACVRSKGRRIWIQNTPKRREAALARALAKASLPPDAVCEVCKKPFCAKRAGISVCGSACGRKKGARLAGEKLRQMAMARAKPQEKCIPCLYAVGIGCKRASKILKVGQIRILTVARALGLKLSQQQVNANSAAYNRSISRNVAQQQREEQAKARGVRLMIQESRRMFVFESSENKAERAKIVRDKFKKRYHRDPAFCMKVRLRRRVRKVITTRGSMKGGTTQELIGCTYQFFVHHIESQFKEGMSWANRHQWHIDHIIPCAAFDLTQPDEQRKCFHWSNMRPLWSTDNLRKGSKMPERRTLDDGKSNIYANLYH
jgi:hypothetical protein